MDYYHAHHYYTGRGVADDRRRLRDFENLHRRLGPTFRPAGHPFAFRTGRFDAEVAAAVPASALHWDDRSRREALTHERLSDFTSMKVQDAFYSKDDPFYAGRASRDATIANTRVLRAKGLIDWTCTTHLYSRLLGIAKEYGLLDEFAPAEPAWVPAGKRRRGRAALIGPGPALGEAREAFLHLHRDVVPDVRLPPDSALATT